MFFPIKVLHRIVDEARLTEFVVRRKMDIKDPILQDVYNLMEDNYRNGFNAKLIEEADSISEYITNNGMEIIKASSLMFFNRNVDLIDEIKLNAKGMKDDIYEMTGSVRRTEDDHEEIENFALLLSDNEEPRLFVEIKEEDSSQPA